jgi:hypothetical protein
MYGPERVQSFNAALPGGCDGTHWKPVSALGLLRTRGPGNIDWPPRLLTCGHIMPVPAVPHGSTTAPAIATIGTHRWGSAGSRRNSRNMATKSRDAGVCRLEAQSGFVGNPVKPDRGRQLKAGESRTHRRLPWIRCAGSQSRQPASNDNLEAAKPASFILACGVPRGTLGELRHLASSDRRDLFHL